MKDIAKMVDIHKKIKPVIIPKELAIEIYDFVYRLGSKTTVRLMIENQDYKEYQKKEEESYYENLKKFDKFLNDKIKTKIG